MQTLETNIDKLHENKMWAGQQLQEQKLRFKNIATVAATRVETMRDLLVNWNFFMETKGLKLNMTLMKPWFCTKKPNFSLYKITFIKENVYYCLLLFFVFSHYSILLLCLYLLMGFCSDSQGVDKILVTAYLSSKYQR